MLERCEVVFEFLHGDFGINLGGGDVRMTENTADGFNGNSLIECQNSKAMSGAMHGDMFAESTFVHHPMDALGHRSIFHRGKNRLTFMTVSSNNLKWNVEQFYLKRNLRLMPLGNDPSSSVNGDDIRRFEFFHVNKGQTCKSCKYKNVTREVKDRLLEVVCHQHDNLLFRQIFSRTDVLGNVKQAEGIPFDESACMSSGNHPLEHLTGQPDGTAVKTTVGAEVNAEIVDELWHKLR